MLERLKKIVCEQNLRLPREGLVILTEGNASQISPDRKFMLIKPSGVEYSALTPAMIVVVDMAGNVVDGKLRPSTDTQTHLELYRQFPHIGGIAHTHSTMATAFAQQRAPIPCYGTTHADAFYGHVPVTRLMKPREIREAYEVNTGRVIAETMQLHRSPCVLVAGHGPFAFGRDAKEAVDYACILEKVAIMAMLARPKSSISKVLLDKHFLRKHGPDSYYGQVRNA